MSFSFLTLAAGWWSNLSTTAISAAIISLLAGILVAGAIFSDVRNKNGAGVVPKAAPTTASSTERSRADGEKADSMEDEPWFPVIEVVNWQEACNLPACPWNFDGCESLEHVIERIWRNPLHHGLREACSVLAGRCKNVRVARCGYNQESAGVHFFLIYVLSTGAELFAGAPQDFAVGVELSSDFDEPWVDPAIEGLRSRAGGPKPVRQAAPQGAGLPLPCLAPFYRIHDGVGVLTSHRHLPVLIASPYESIKGSCFYVYPARAIKPFGRGDHLVRFARVDSRCFACTNRHDQRSGVVYVDGKGDLEPDEQSPLDFVADTVANITGHNVVPSWVNPHGMMRHY